MTELTKRGTPKLERRYGVERDVLRYFEEHEGQRVYIDEMMRVLHIEPRSRIQQAVIRLRQKGHIIEIIRPGDCWIYTSKVVFESLEESAPEFATPNTPENLKVIHIAPEGRLFAVDPGGNLYRAERV